MVYLRLLFITLALSALTACDGGYKDTATGTRTAEAPESTAGYTEDQIEMEPPRTAEPPPPPGSAREDGQNPTLAANRKIIYTGSIRMQVDSLDLALAKVTDLVDQVGGYIGSQHISNSNYEKEAVLVIRLPVEGFQPAMNSVTQLAKFVNAQNLDSRDVSAQWIDLESRLKTKRDVRDRYIEVLRKRAAKVEDILARRRKDSRHYRRDRSQRGSTPLLTRSGQPEYPGTDHVPNPGLPQRASNLPQRLWSEDCRFTFRRL